MVGAGNHSYAQRMEDVPSFSRAIEKYGAGRLAEARAELLALVEAEPSAPAWSAIGYLERDKGDAAAAAAAFDRALSFDENDTTALNGRARVALERAEGDVLKRYAEALDLSPGNPQLMLELTEARIERGDESALDDFATFAARLPGWSEGQIALARMRWETRRDPEFARGVRDLLAREPRGADLWLGLIELLTHLDRFGDAADAARDARGAIGNAPNLLLGEAVNASRAGQIDRADSLFMRLPAAMAGAAAEKALHYLRKGELERAGQAVEAAVTADPASINAWAAAELTYRALGDPRSEWLSGQPELVRHCELTIDPQVMDRTKALLLNLHQSGVQAAGQSVREGTQTRWRLFDRTEPELAELKRAIQTAIAHYVEGLPPVDARHPLLRHRDSTLAITGSWSVRLTGSGRHVSHVHPLGLIGSACYLIVPDGEGGELELGRPPPDLMLDLKPLHVITPRPGRLVLFPSYLHHGTTPFQSGERLTVAFDVARDPGA